MEPYERITSLAYTRKPVIAPAFSLPKSCPAMVQSLAAREPSKANVRVEVRAGKGDLGDGRSVNFSCEAFVEGSFRQRNKESTK